MTGRLHTKQLLKKTKPWECEFCHTRKNLTVHHQNGVKEDYEISNLMVVCRECHNSIHGLENLNEKWAFNNELGWYRSIRFLKSLEVKA